MNDFVIRAEGLGKKYMIGHQLAARDTTFRDVLAWQARGIGRSAMDILRGRPNIAGDELEEFWALKDINFEIRRGDVVGIIGSNGAGKSTLLKILSRITEPSEGHVTIEGRVASLLEVGTGFHPELTGRENIFLNGAILGMKRGEIKRKFDEIVDFAGVEKFLDTPVKRYSSGMYVRLAFSVAAHLEPEILVVDEVLAVGDAEFQKKCLGKMGSMVLGDSRSIIFVSHNLAAIDTLCSSAAYFREGKLVSQGETRAQIARHNQDTLSSQCRSRSVAHHVEAGLTLDLVEFTPNPVHSRNNCEFQLSFSATKETKIYDVCIIINNVMGLRTAIIDLRRSGITYIASSTPLVIKGSITQLNLVEGIYSIGLFIRTSDFSGELLDICNLQILDSEDQRGLSTYPANHRGVVDLDFSFASLDGENNGESEI